MAQGDEGMDPWAHAFHTESFGDSLNRMREAAMNRHGRKVRELDGSLSVTEDIEIKELEALRPLRISASGEIAPERHPMGPRRFGIPDPLDQIRPHFRGKRSPGKLVSAEFFYEEDDEAGEDFSGPTFAWNE